MGNFNVLTIGKIKETNFHFSSIHFVAAATAAGLSTGLSPNKFFGPQIAASPSRRRKREVQY